MVTYLFLIIAELFIYQLDANIIYNPLKHTDKRRTYNENDDMTFVSPH